jgi:hypothetical protein
MSVDTRKHCPPGLIPVLAAGAKASRFAGKAGQLHEGFCGPLMAASVQRVALAGAGEARQQGSHLLCA